MKVRVDYQRCEGHGMCERVAPTLFRLDEQGMLVAAYEGRDVPPELEEAADEAVRLCPVAALAIEEES